MYSLSDSPILTLEETLRLERPSRTIYEEKGLRFDFFFYPKGKKKLLIFFLLRYLKIKESCLHFIGGLGVKISMIMIVYVYQIRLYTLTRKFWADGCRDQEILGR